MTVEPVPLIVPPLACQVTLVSAAPVTVAVKDCVLPPGMVCCEGNKVTTMLCFVAEAVTVIVAEPDAPEGSPEVATTVAVVAVVGAV